MALRMSEKEFQRLSKNGIRTNKFHNEKVREGALIFDSKGEYERYKYLQVLENSHEISSLTFHEEQLVLLENPLVRYIPDFCYIEAGVKVIEDFKGTQTKEFILKKKMIISMIRNGTFEGIFRIVKKDSRNGYVVTEEYGPGQKKDATPCEHEWVQYGRKIKWCRKCGCINDGKNTESPICYIP